MGGAAAGARTQDPLRELPALLVFFTLAQLPRYGFDHHLAALRPGRRGVAQPLAAAARAVPGGALLGG